MTKIIYFPYVMFIFFPYFIGNVYLMKCSPFSITIKKQNLKCYRSNQIISKKITISIWIFLIIIVVHRNNPKSFSAIYLNTIDKFSYNFWSCIFLRSEFDNNIYICDILQWSCYINFCLSSHVKNQAVHWEDKTRDMRGVTK